MSDLRRIEVEHTTRRLFEIDVDKWFAEFADEWAEFRDDPDYDDKAEASRDFIRETAYELWDELDMHAEGEIGSADVDVDITITSASGISAAAPGEEGEAR